jgi:hypothetical protein
VLALAGKALNGPAHSRAQEFGVRLVLVGDVDWDRIVELYVAADVFALLSARAPGPSS